MTVTADGLRARLQADLRVVYAIRQADRPEGLTASRVLGCRSYAARTLLDEPKGHSDDVWRALRGAYIHDGLNDDLAGVEPGFMDGRKQRFTWDPGGGLPVITGEYDFVLPAEDGTEGGVVCEVKTRSRDECRWHADHGPRENEAGQVAAAAVALNCHRAAIVYLPTDAGLDEMAVAMIDPAHWARQALHWLVQVDVRDEYAGLVERGMPRDRALRQVLDPIPRDMPYSWCRLLCDRVKNCRGDYVPPADLEILDPNIRAASQAAAHHRELRLHHERMEKAAKSQLAHVEGTASDAGETLRVTQQDVPATPGRRGHTKIKVERRSD